MAVDIRGAARCSIGFRIPAKSLELQHTIRLIRELDAEIEEIEAAIQTIMDELHSPIATIPGNGCRMDAMILAGIGDFSRFDSPDKLLAYAGMSPSTYLSGQLKNCYPHMEKPSSRYLRYALYNAAKNWYGSSSLWRNPDSLIAPRFDSPNSYLGSCRTSICCTLLEPSNFLHPSFILWPGF